MPIYKVIMDLHGIFGLTAAAVALAAFPVYIHSIIKGRTRPSRVTWWILGLSGTLLAASYYASGARDTAWIAIAYAAGYIVVALLSLQYGHSKWTLTDSVCLALALLSGGLWWLLDNPLIALYVNVGIDVLGILPTMYKTYRKPSTESRTAWLMDVVAAVFALLAIEEWTFAIALYPVYLLLTNCVILILILRKQHSWRLNR